MFTTWRNVEDFFYLNVSSTQPRENAFWPLTQFVIFMLRSQIDYILVIMAILIVKTPERNFKCITDLEWYTRRIDNVRTWFLSRRIWTYLARWRHSVSGNFPFLGNTHTPVKRTTSLRLHIWIHRKDRLQWVIRRHLLGKQYWYIVNVGAI